MDEHMTPFLGAYMDDELEGQIHENVRVHLAVCRQCRKELSEMQKLSGLLHSTATVPVSSRVFASRLARQLSQRAMPVEAPAPGSLLLWLIPVLVLIIALVVQISSGMTLVMLAANQAGLLGRLGTLLAGATQMTGQAEPLFDLITLALAGDWNAISTGFNALFTLRNNLVGLILQGSLAFIYIACMLILWGNRNRLLATTTKKRVLNNVGIGK